VSAFSAYCWFTRDSRGDLSIVTKHPHDSLTWHWGISLCKFMSGERRRFLLSVDGKWPQRHHRLNLFGWRYICFSTQNYHRRPKAWAKT